MTTFTTNYALTKSLIGGRTDLWGQDIHDSYDIIDAQMKTNADAAAAADAKAGDASSLTTGTLPIARIADGTVTNVKLASDLDASKLTVGALPDARLSANVPLVGAVATLTAGNHVDGTNNLRLYRIGNLRVLRSVSALGYAGGFRNSGSSNPGVIPVADRPSVTWSDVYRSDGFDRARAQVTSGGTLSWFHNACDGCAAVAVVGPGSFSLIWMVD